MRFGKKTKTKTSPVRRLVASTGKEVKKPIALVNVAHGITRQEEPWGKNQLIVGTYVTGIDEDDIVYKPQLYLIRKKRKTPRILKTINKFLIG